MSRKPPSHLFDVEATRKMRWSSTSSMRPVILRNNSTLLGAIADIPPISISFPPGVTLRIASAGFGSGKSCSSSIATFAEPATNTSIRIKVAEAPQAPKWAGVVLTVFAKSPHAAEAAIGCMHERFARDCAKYGVRHATIYCWADTARSLWPLLRRTIGRAVKLAAIISAVKRLFVG